jgi:HK97 family phage portal protein
MRRTLFSPGSDDQPVTVRATFEQAIQRALGSHAMLDDATLARAFATSATAYAAAMYCANTLSTVPLVVHAASGAAADAGPLTWFQANRARLLADVTLYLLLFGRAYLWKRPNRWGFLTGLVALSPLQVREITGERQRVIAYEIRDRQGYVAEYRAAPDSLIYLEEFDPQPDGMGLSRFEVAWRTLGIEQGIATYAAAFFTNGANPAGVLTFDDALSDRQYEEARKEWKAQFQGAAQAHRTAVMPAGAKWTAIQAAPKDLIMPELKQSAREDVAAVFGVSLPLLGLADVADPLSAGSTYTGQETAHVRNVALPRLETIILPALNEQWVWQDLNHGDTLTLAVDRAQVPQLAEAELTKSTTASALAGDTLLDYNEARGMFGYPARDDYPIRRNPSEAQTLWRDGIITLGETQVLIGLRETADDPALDVLLIGGQIVPRTRLLEIANRNADLPALAPAGGMTIEAPALPAPGAAPQLASGTPVPPAPEARAGQSVTAMLMLSRDPDLVALQHRLRALYADQSVQWSDPEDFHITLVYIPDATPEQAAAFADAMTSLDDSILRAAAGMRLTVGSLTAFDSVGEYALHFRIRRNQQLIDFQRALYDIAAGLGVGLSSYSAPDAYIPHITMGYCATRPRSVTFQSKLAVRPGLLRIADDDNPLADLELVSGDVVDTEAPAAPEPETRSARTVLELAIPFADHAYVRAAARTLGLHLAPLGIAAQYLHPSEWRIVLARTEQGTPAQAARLLRESDYAGAAKLDLMSAGYRIDGSLISLALEPSAELDALMRAAALDVDADSLEPRIVLAQVLDELPDELPEARYPLVATSVEVTLGGRTMHTWNLRGLSTAQTRELDNWHYIVGRRGRDAAFTARALSPIVAAYVTLSLEDADLDTAQVFSSARDMLRAYRDTRAGFIASVTDIITRARSDDGSRQAFGAAMRAACRRFGLQAMFDAFEDAGLVDVISLDQDQLTMFRAWQAETSDYVRNFGAELFKEGGITDTEVPYRAGLWANKTLDDIYFTALRSAAGALEADWRVDPAKEHCDDCLKRNGQRLTLDEWGQIGFPRDRRLECGGWQCGCDLVDVRTGKVFSAR